MSTQHQSEHRVRRTATRWLAPFALVLGFACLSLAGGAAPAAADQWGGESWGQQWSQQKWRKSWSHKSWSQGDWSHKKWSDSDGKHSWRHNRHRFHHGFPPRFAFGGNGFFFSSPGFFVPPRFVAQQPLFIVRQPAFIVRQPGFIVRQPGFAAVPPVVIKRHHPLQHGMVPVVRSAGPRFITPGMMSPSIRIIRPGN